MRLYFEFEDRRVLAEVTWPRNAETIVVHITDALLAKQFPTDLYFDIKQGNKISYIVEDSANKRLVELQEILSRRLQNL